MSSDLLSVSGKQGKALATGASARPGIGADHVRGRSVAELPRCDVPGCAGSHRQAESGNRAHRATGRLLLRHAAAPARAAADRLRLRPDWTQHAVARFRAWLARSGRQAAEIGASAVGVLL